jgi:hypothetical protein
MPMQVEDDTGLNGRDSKTMEPFLVARIESEQLRRRANLNSPHTYPSI